MNKLVVMKMVYFGNLNLITSNLWFEHIEWTDHADTRFVQHMGIRSSGMNKCRVRQDAGSDNHGRFYIFMAKQFCKG